MTDDTAATTESETKAQDTTYLSTSFCKCLGGAVVAGGLFAASSALFRTSYRQVQDSGYALSQYYASDPDKWQRIYFGAMAHHPNAAPIVGSGLGTIALVGSVAGYCCMFVGAGEVIHKVEERVKKVSTSLKVAQPLGAMERPEGRPHDPPRRLRIEAPEREPRASLVDVANRTMQWEEFRQVVPLVEPAPVSTSTRYATHFPEAERKFFALDINGLDE